MWSWPGSSGHYISLHLSSAWPALVRLAVIRDTLSLRQSLMAQMAGLQRLRGPSVSEARLFSVRVQHTEICHCLPNVTSCQQIHAQIMRCSVLHVFLLNAISILISPQTIWVGLFTMSHFKYLFNNKYLTFTHICGMLVIIMKYFVYYFIHRYIICNFWNNFSEHKKQTIVSNTICAISYEDLPCSHCDT